MLFEFQNRINKLTLKLIIGPRLEEERQSFIHYVLKHKKIFNGIQKQRGSSFTQIYTKDFLSKHFNEEFDYDEIIHGINEKFDRFLKYDLNEIENLLNQNRKNSLP